MTKPSITMDGEGTLDIYHFLAAVHASVICLKYIMKLYFFIAFRMLESVHLL
jgi:hypothetical protein